MGQLEASKSGGQHTEDGLVVPLRLPLAGLDGILQVGLAVSLAHARSTYNRQALQDEVALREVVHQEA